MDGLIELSLRYGPYVVILGVICLFLLCCYFLFRDKKGSTSNKIVDSLSYDDPYEHQRRTFQNPYALRDEELSVDPVEDDFVEGIVSEELVRAVKEQPPEEAEDATRIMPKVTERMITETIEAQPEASIKLAVKEQTLLDKAVAQYKSAFGILNPESEEKVTEITEAILAQLDTKSEEETTHLFENIALQESLLHVQKAYVANSTEWMKEILLETFKDVVEQPQSSTLYLVAVDALKSLVHLQVGHLQALAISLIIQYSKNSNNYSVENFRHYMEKYIEPFMSDLPRKEDMYQQLEYLRCISFGETLSFQQIMRNSYPLVFDYRGFSHEELAFIVQDTPVKMPIVVESINSSLLKLMAVDEYMLPSLFKRAGLTDISIQNGLTRLAFGKAVDWDSTSFDEVLERISPLLVDFSHIYDRAPLSRLHLTLLGIYLGSAMVRATIHEQFDVSPWFDTSGRH
ncbi:LPO_1073/Vpar_1526 family protein [Veillonella sp. CHU594]|uniref:LPO_1073/Vpar_1526 family protein n=1 Tax=Veillonella sp. CHU594 TaxID=2490948 RepID=UPI000F8D8634|nr:LPO_1073/Vpar_1526 family protein [Veillonella sp. CHU594]